jgi:hypothetical protein
LVKVALFVDARDARVAVVWWVSEHDEDGASLLDGFALAFEFGKKNDRGWRSGTESRVHPPTSSQKPDNRHYHP